MSMGRGGIFGDPNMSFGGLEQNNPFKRKRGLLNEDYNDFEMGPEAQAALDRASVAPESEKKGLLGFWQGGDKFTARDGIAGLLAAVGDAFAQENGMQGSAVSGLTGGRAKAMAAAKAAMAEQALAADAGKMGISPEQFRLMRAGVDLPKAPEAPEKARIAEWYRNATPEQQRAFDQTNPIVTNGYGSTVVPRSSIGGGTAPGTIEDGYQFIGGDDKDPKNWRPVQGGAGSSPRPFLR